MHVLCLFHFNRIPPAQPSTTKSVDVGLRRENEFGRFASYQSQHLNYSQQRYFPPYYLFNMCSHPRGTCNLADPFFLNFEPSIPRE